MNKVAVLITCGASAPKASPPPKTIEATDPAITASRDNERKRRKAAGSNTFLSGYGAPAATSPVKTLLGQ